MTAVSVAAVTTLSNVAAIPSRAAPIVSTPSIGDAAVGSAVIMKNCSQASVASNPSYPHSPIGSSAVPWKQKYATASESARW